MNHDDMLRLFETHREAARDFDAILATFTQDCAGGSSGLS
jgi:hypothetical protein